MIERFIAPALTFAVLVGGHVAIAIALFAGPAPQVDDAPLSARAAQAEQSVAKRAS
jgi:hypothetical protein